MRGALFAALTAAGVGVTMILALLLGGCATPQTLRGSGEPAMPPAGYVKLCAEHPDFAGCTP